MPRTWPRGSRQRSGRWAHDALLTRRCYQAEVRAIPGRYCSITYPLLSFFHWGDDGYHDRLSGVRSQERPSWVESYCPGCCSQTWRLTRGGHTISAEARGAQRISSLLPTQRLSWYFLHRGVSSHPASKDGDPSKRCRDLSQAARGEPACAFHDVVQLISGLGAPPTPNGSRFAAPTCRNRCISRLAGEKLR